MAVKAVQRMRYVHLSFDAFGTLFRPVPSVPEQYVAVARKYGLSNIPIEGLGQSFKTAYKSMSLKSPNYGRHLDGMSAKNWWSEVIKSTFEPHLPPNRPLPQGIITTLWRRFSNKQAYQKYEEVDSFFRQLKVLQQNPSSLSEAAFQPDPPKTLVVSVLSNCDNRLPQILRRLHIGEMGPEFMDNTSIFTSHRIAVEKPAKRAFDIVQKTVHQELWRKYVHGRYKTWDLYGRCHYVGDDYKNDFVGSAQAGWIPYHLDRSGIFKDIIPEADGYAEVPREEVFHRLGKETPVRPCPAKVIVLNNLMPLLHGALR